jgi:hypothetical protein
MLIRPAAQPQATDDVAPTNQSKVAGRTGITATFGERQRPWTEGAPVTNEFTDPLLYSPKPNGARTTDSTPDFQRTHRNRER